MTTIGVQRRIVWVVMAIPLLLQFSAVLSGSPADEQLAVAQGSRSPGSRVPATEKEGHKQGRGIEVTCLKWITTSPLMAGFTGGDAAGDFVGKVLQRQVSLNGRIVRLEAMYEVQAGDRSFTALIRGGTASVTGAAVLDGVILAGWRTGAPVHVEFQTYAPLPTGPGCPDARAPTDRPCFKGTIHIGRASED